MEYQEIRKQFVSVGQDSKGTPIFQLTTSTGCAYVREMRKPGGELAFLGVKEVEHGVLASTWSWLDPQKFCRLYEKQAPVKLVVHSYRRHGQPKLQKPPLIKGVKQSYSVKYSGWAACACFLTDNDIWFKHRDFFSDTWEPPEEDKDKDTPYLVAKYLGRRVRTNKVYNDCFSSIILRGEAWLQIQNIIPLIERKNPYIARQTVFLGMENWLLEAISSQDYCYLRWEDLIDDIIRKAAETRSGCRFDIE